MPAEWVDALYLYNVYAADENGDETGIASTFDWGRAEALADEHRAATGDRTWVMQEQLDDDGVTVLNIDFWYEA